MVSHENNFDLLRFVFAFAVFLFHAHLLPGRPDLTPLAPWFPADLAVKAFFVVSGYLVFMSFENSRSLKDYFAKRARRIYPAYFVVVAACALAGVALTVLPLRDYLAPGLASYLAANLAFLNFLAPELPGVFQDNPYRAVNGALWTLKIEVMFYVGVPIIAAFWRRLGRIPVLAAAYVLSVAYLLIFEHLARETGRGIFTHLALQVPGQLAYFLAGAALYYYPPQGLRRWLPLAAVAVVALLAPLPRVLDAALEPAALGVLVVFFAVGVRYLGNFGRYGDLSYGVYIIHFPVLQAMITAGAFREHPYAAVGGATMLVLAGAFASWHLVEKPFLRKSSHYVVATGATGTR